VIPEEDMEYDPYLHPFNVAYFNRNDDEEECENPSNDMENNACFTNLRKINPFFPFLMPFSEA
jgi:hypothetical protein